MPIDVPGQPQDQEPPNPYDALEEQLASPEPAPPAAPAAPAKPYADLETALDEQESARDQQGRVLFEAAFSKSPDQSRAIAEIVQQTGLPPGVVEERVPEFKAKWEAAQRDPRRLRREQPELWQLLFENPQYAPAVVHEVEKISPVTRFIRGITDYAAAHPLLSGGGMPAQFGAGEILDLEDQIAGREPTVEGRSMKVPEPKKNVPYVVDPSSGLEGVERVLGKWRWVPQAEDPNDVTGFGAMGVGGISPGTGRAPNLRLEQVQPGIYQAAWESTAKQSEYSRTGFERLALRMARGALDPRSVPGAVADLDKRVWEADKRALDMGRDLTARSYGQGPFEQIALDGVEVNESYYEVLKGGGKAGAIGAGVGGVIGAIARSPALAKRLAKAGWKAGSKAGAALTSFELESGGFFNEAMGEKLDDGTFVSEEVAVGGAVIYGAIASAIEMDALGTSLGMAGPLGDAIKSGEGKAFMRGMLRDANLRAIFADAGRRWLKGSAAEAKEEFLQEEAQALVDYFGQSAQAGEFQKGDPGAALARGVEVGVKTFTGTMVGGAPAVVLGVHTQLMARDRSLAAGQKVAAIVKMAKDTEASRAAAPLVAELIERESAKSGEPIANLYVDAGAFTRLFQEQGADPMAAARDLMGEEGPARLQAALAGAFAGPDGKPRLEVPVAEYLQKWGGKPVSEALASDTTTRPGLMTTRELIENQSRVREQAQALADSWLKDEGAMPPPASEAETRLVEVVEGQLAESAKGKLTAKDASRSVALVRAMLRTQAESFKVDPDVLFRDYTLTVQRQGLERAAAEGDLAPAAAAQQQGPAPFSGTQDTLGSDTTHDQGGVSPGTQAGEMDRARYEARLRGSQRLDAIKAELDALHQVRLAFHEGQAAANPAAYAEQPAALRASAEVYGRSVAWDVPESVQASRLRSEDWRVRQFFPDGVQGADTMRTEPARAMREAERDRLVWQGMDRAAASAALGLPGVDQRLEQADPSTAHVDFRDGEVEVTHPESPIRLRATQEGTTLSIALLDAGVPETRQNLAQVGGQGYSTALYVRTLQEAQRNGLSVQSDTIRTPATERMYNRLQAMGIPFALKGDGSTFFISAEELKATDLDKAWRTLQAETEIRSLRAGIRLFQLRQTETAEFKAWFGDSKVVGPDGKPLVVYHGTSSSGFEVFDVARQDKASLYGPGFYFTEDPSIASEYVEKGANGSPGVLPVFVKVERPFKVDSTAAELLPLLKKFKAKNPPADVKRLIDAAMKEDPTVLSPDGAGVWIDNTEWAYRIADAKGMSGEEMVRPYFDYFIARAVKVIEADLKAGHIPKGEQFGEEVVRFIERNVFEQMEEGGANIKDVLTRLGFDGITHIGGRNVGTKDHRVWIAFGPTQIKSATGNRGTFDSSDPNILHQGEKKGAERGWVDIVRKGLEKVFKVTLTDQHDLSTFLHETGHTFLEMMADLSERPDAPERIKQDFAKALEYLGLKDAAAFRALTSESRSILAAARAEGRDHENLTDAERKRLAELAEPQEKWARSFEAYLMEGRAPSAALAGAFQRFRLWLLDIYRSVTALGVELTPELRGVFDRLLATDTEIAKMQKVMGVADPLFASHVEAGMSPEQYASYLKDREQSLAHAVRQTTAKVMSERLRQTEGWWKEKREEFRKAALAEFDDRQDSRAFRYLKRGEVTTEDGRRVSAREMGKLDRAAVRAMGLPMKVLEEMLRGRLAKEAGENPEEVARRFGYPSGKAMLQGLLSMPDRETWAEQLADERMAQRYPDILSERDRLKEEAAKALHSDLTSDWLLKEWVALKRQSVSVFNPEANKTQSISSKRLGPEQAQAEVPLEAIREAARIIAGKVKVGQINAGQALRAEGAAADKAAIAAAKGDYAQAYVFKQQQLLNHYLFRELSEAKEGREKVVALADRMADQKRRGVLGKAGSMFRDASDLLLEALGLKERETDPDALAERATMPEALKALEAAGIFPAFDTSLLARTVAQPPTPPKPKQAPWQGLTVDELRTVGAALAQLYTAARDANLVMMEGKRVEIGKLAGDIRSEAERLPVKRQPPGSDSAAPRGWWAEQRLQGINASLTDPEYLIELLGPTAYRFFWRGYLEHREIEHKLAEEVGKFFAEQWDALPKEMQEKRYDLVDASGLPFPGDLNRDGSQRDRAWAWMLWLNMANRSNMDRTLGGYGWDEKTVRAWLSATLTKEEVDFLQGVLNLLDEKLWPKVAEAYEKVNGVRPKKIENLPFTMTFADGRTETYRGGYFPARYDPVASRVGKDQAAEDLTKMYAGRAGAISVAKSFTQERVKKYTDVVNLQWSVVPGHVMQVIHYVAFDSFVRDAARVLLHGETQQAISRHLGPKYAPQLEGWLRAVSTATNDLVPQELEDTYAFVRSAKSAFVTSTLGYSLSVAAGDLTNPLVAIASGRVKARYMAPSLALATNPLTYRDMRAKALATSGELAQRTHNMRDRLRRQLTEVGKQGKKSKAGRIREAVMESAWVFMEMTDRLTSTIIWDGAFRQAMAEGLSEKDAALEADRAVRAMLPSHNAAEQAAFLRDKRGLGAITAFYGYFSKLYNVNRNIWHDPYVAWSEAESAGEALAATGKTARAAGRVLAVFFVTSVLAEFITGRGPEEDEKVAEWITRKMLAAPFTLIPMVGALGEEGASRLTSYLWHGKSKHRQFSMRASPAAGAVERVGRALLRALDEKRDPDQRFWDVVEVAGAGVPGTDLNIGPLGSNQVSRTGRYITSGKLRQDVGAGRYAEAAGGLVFGEKDKGQPKNPGTALQDILGR